MNSARLAALVIAGSSLVAACGSDDGGSADEGSAAPGQTSEGEGEAAPELTPCEQQIADDACDRTAMVAACGPAPTCSPDVWSDPANCVADAACPGGPGCETGSGGFQAGFAKVDVTPGFELPHEEHFNDDAYWQGSRFDPSHWKDCGRDQLCEGDPGYTAPDADGSEGDGLFQAAWLAGFHNQRPGIGVHDPMWARCAVFSAGDTRVALVALDLVGLFYNELVRMREAIKAEAGVDLVIMSSTHSHEVPDTLGQWGPDDQSDVPAATGRDEVTQKGVRDGAVKCVEDAVAGLRDANLFHGMVRTGIDGFSRDTRDPFIHDDEMPVMRVEAADSGEILGTIVNWGTHPEALSDENLLISSDFPHYLRQTVEDGLAPLGAHPGIDGLGGVTVYFSGAVGGLTTPLGDINATYRDGTPAQGEGKDVWDKTQAVGEGLGLLAIDALLDAQADPDPSVSFVTREFIVPVVNRQFHVAFFGANVFDRPFYNFRGESEGQFCLFSDDNFPWVLTQIAIVRVGQATFFTVPGEIFPESVVGFDDSYSFGKDRLDPGNENPPDMSAIPTEAPLKRIMPGRTVFLLGLGNDELGYFVPPYDFELDATQPWFDQAPGDHYEETNSVGPDILPLVEGHARDLAAKLQ